MWTRKASSRLGCCPLFSMDAIYRGAMFIWSANSFLDNPFTFRASCMAGPKALKSYLIFSCFILFHPITFYCSPYPLRYDYTYHGVDLNKAYFYFVLS